MAQEVDIREGDLDEHVEQARQWIASGFIIVAPLEHGYAFLADAFSHDAVRAIHVLRGDDLGVVAQVMVADTSVLSGITREVPTGARTLMDAFWPGLLSFTLLPHRGLSWDLGDDKRLDEVSVRVPSSEFMLRLLRKTGPLAVASAARVGQPATLDVSSIPALDRDLAGIFHAGELESGPSSTIVLATETELLVERVGAITLEQLAEVLPAILEDTTPE
ncbi:MAG: Sua5/YciO/YrdC/YwlC family protein [Actinobacteria bacterium]|nr:Sua5/YciO/YrdC/YwlC family protein [Actinomycetota bacterium]